MKHSRPYNKSVYRSFALIMQFGINMLVPIGMMTALGVWIDRKLETSFWVVILFFIGAIAGGQNIYRMAKQIYSQPPEKNSKAISAAKAPNHSDTAMCNTKKKEPAKTDENTTIPEKRQ